MSFPLLRDCLRLGISVFGLTSGALTETKKIVMRKIESCIRDMGFVSRDEFEAMSESLKRADGNHKKECSEHKESEKK
ncbi:MAG: hypothetical protein ACTJLL_03290 [Anaplasma sp.]